MLALNLSLVRHMPTNKSLNTRQHLLCTTSFFFQIFVNLSFYIIIKWTFAELVKTVFKILKKESIFLNVCLSVRSWFVVRVWCEINVTPLPLFYRTLWTIGTQSISILKVPTWTHIIHRESSQNKGLQDGGPLRWTIGPMSEKVRYEGDRKTWAASKSKKNL